MERKEYQLTADELKEASTSSADQIPNFWKKIGEKYGFDPKTVRFVKGAENQFSAEPIPTGNENHFQKGALVQKGALAPEAVYDFNSYSTEYALVVTGDRAGDLNQRIEQWKEQFSTLVIKDEKDKAGYEAVAQAISILRTTRNLVDSKRKELKSKPIELGKLIDKTAKDIIDTLAPLEERLKEEKARIDSLKEEQKKKKAMEIERKFNERVSVLQANGMAFTGMGYKLNDIIVGTLELKSMTDSEWDAFRVKVVAVWEEESQRKIKEKEEEEKRMAEEQKQKAISYRTDLLKSLGFEQNEETLTRSFISDKFASVQPIKITKLQLGSSVEEWDLLVDPVYKDLTASAEEGRERKIAIEKEQARQEQEKRDLEEKQKQLAAKTKQARILELNSMGLTYNFRTFDRTLKFNSISIPSTILDLGDDEWDAEVKKITKQCDELDAKEKDDVEREQKALRQVAELNERIRKEEEEKKAIQAESLKGDKQKLIEFADKIEKTEYPTCQEEVSNAVVARALGQLSELAQYIRGEANNL